jgi:3-oxoacyl-[acyl-carrier-protein] synthase II
MTKKIVVTGMGATSPIGGTVADTWTALLAKKSGAATLPNDWAEQYAIPVNFAARALVRPEEVLERTEAKRLDPSSQFALISAREAWSHAGSPEIDPNRLGVDYSTGVGGLWTLLDAWDTLREKGSRRVLPLTVPMLMPNAAAAAISMSFEARAFARTGASACASSTEAIANAYDHLQQGHADIIIAGGTESAIHPLTVSAFSSMQALSKRNDSPETASRPYDITRDGFVMGEGAASVVMETEEHALARGATIYAEIAGGGVTSDSYHITAPDPEGRGAVRAILLALEQAGADRDEVMHINAHATSTPVGDAAEYEALESFFGERVHGIPVSATKGATGHLLGGTGALEAIFTIMALYERTAPPTINLTELDPAIKLDVVTEPRKLADGPLLAISNSFGFGGHNAVLAIRSYEK